MSVIGVIVAVGGGVLGLWMKFHQQNSREHAELHKKIERLDEKSESRGVAVRKAVDQVMEHLLEVKR